MATVNPEQAEAVDWLASDHAAAVLSAKAQRENVESLTAHNAAAAKLMEARAGLCHTIGALAIILSLAWSVFAWVRFG